MVKPSRTVLVALFAVLAIAAGALAVRVPTARAGTIYMSSCSRMGDNGEDTDLSGLVWRGSGAGAYALFNRCPQKGSFQIEGTYFAKSRQAAQWRTTAPPSIEIVHAWTPNDHVLISSKVKADGYRARFMWGGGSQSITPQSKCCGSMYYGSPIDRWLGPSRYFAFQVRCVKGPCTPPHGQLLDVNAIQLMGEDNTPPRLSAIGANNLWYQGAHWIRGTWPASFSATDDSGVCGMQAEVDGQWIPGPADTSPNRHSWTQCPTPETMTLSVDTTSYPDGPLSLKLTARDAATPANVAAPSAILRVDNQPVSLKLSGPTDAPSTAGTQYVTATAAAGPSGVAGIACSVNGAHYQWHPGRSGRIAVAGIGRHHVVCYAQNRSIDSSGVPASSPPVSWSLSIRQPTVFALGFAHTAAALRCRRVREHVKVPGRWVTIRYHHKRVRVRTRPRLTSRRVTRCHPRTVRRRVSVWRTVIVGGRPERVRVTRVVRVAVAPHKVMRTHRRVAHGAAVTVTGWLGTLGGGALAGQRVKVLTAADNQLGHFHLAATVTTRKDGSWSVRLRPGPSRLIEAVYAGGATTEPSTSAQVRLIVPAAVRLFVHPHHTNWGGTIQITGRVLGGYIPPGKLLRLRIGADGVHGTVGIPDIDTDGRFHTTWTFAAGRGTVHYWFSVSTLREADYPYAPASSRRVRVLVR